MRQAHASLDAFTSARLDGRGLMAAAIATFDLTTSPTCHGCGGALVEKFPDVEDPQTNERFAIAACERCGLGETRPQPDDLGKYYGSAYHGGRHSFTARYCAARRAGLA